MKFIAHRGNISGPNPKRENSPNYIDAAIDLGYDVEIDVWSNNGVLRLGHDFGSYRIPTFFLMHRANNLWIHAKNHEAFETLSRYQSLNVFWHQVDDFALTTKGFVWCYPGIGPINRSVAVSPEMDMLNLDKFYAICSDDIASFKEKYDKDTYSSIS